MQPDLFKLRRRQATLWVLALAGLTYGAMLITEYDPVRGITAVPRAAIWALSNFTPDQEAFRRLPRILAKLRDTVLMSIASATVASACALVVALMGARTTRLHPGLSLVVRGLASVFRNIDVSAWALILLFSFGQSAYTGYLALFFVTFGFMVRVMIETIDEVSTESVEALRATGA
ncbi:MAG: phosphonate ABC transporter permease, partial [Oscillochloris sp.]|nr:phosphonate ABC transporter permease [Oscillochloris sp.]